MRSSLACMPVTPARARYALRNVACATACDVSMRFYRGHASKAAYHVVQHGVNLFVRQRLLALLAWRASQSAASALWPRGAAGARLRIELQVDGQLKAGCQRLGLLRRAGRQVAKRAHLELVQPALRQHSARVHIRVSVAARDAQRGGARLKRRNASRRR